MSFSDRIGLTSPKIKIQIDSLDNDLLNSLWNCFSLSYADRIKSQPYDVISLSKYKDFVKSIWANFFKEPLDTMPNTNSGAINYIREKFYSYNWYEVYNFIEFILKNPEARNNDNFTESLNTVLARELAGYRIIAGEVTPITDQFQVSQIQSAIDNTSKELLKGVNIHINSALNKLSDKKSPDYRNSIKESISAVESMVQIITGDSKAELGKGLKIIKDKIGLHTALEQGFIKIYGYTSDSDGIRHSLMEESTLDIEDAIFMLTSCSAFINYLFVKSDKAKLV
ncbi:hypothetical protein AAGV28_01735 [Flavobacterium sp. FZUC8N2.13]|uniref:HEPN AbiJ-N-terminal domain-containing protein n=1 Tax=Flavobacterium zubiriense TaxID=3138075 RepID=A0ABV4T7J2_9FLAO